MSKRTMNEIEKDYMRIRAAVDIIAVTSINGIAKSLGLTKSEVKTSLSRHPRIEKEIMAHLEKNRKELKGKKNDVEAKKNEKTMVEDNVKQFEKTTDFDTGFVIDASIAGTEELEKIFSDPCAKNAKIILTSITVKELEKMQKFNDVYATDARHILAMAAENQNKFHTVQIDETIGIPDDCIIKYCADNKDMVILLTADKTMALKARMHDVKTQYFKHEKRNKTTTTQPNACCHGKKNTLWDARKEGNRLYITALNSKYRSIMVISEGCEYTEGKRELKTGDDVYLATKKPEYITFAHYRITSLFAENNCNLVYYKRIYKATEICNLPKAGYKSFMRDFKCRHDL